MGTRPSTSLWSMRPGPTLSRRCPRPSPPPWPRTLESQSLLSRPTSSTELPTCPPPSPLSDTLPSEWLDTPVSPLLPDTPDTPDTPWLWPVTKLVVQPIPCTLQRVNCTVSTVKD